MDKKRLLLIILFFVVSILVGYALYRVFFAKPAPLPSPTPSEPTPGGAFPEAVSGTPIGTIRPPTILPTAQPTSTRPRGGFVRPAEPIVSRIASDTVVAPRLGANGQVDFYNQANGQFYRVDAAGQLRALSDQVFYNVQNVTWSPTANESIIEYPDGNNIYYNFDTKKQVTLPKHWEGFSFSPQGGAIAAKSVGFSPENRFLVTANPDGTNVTAVEPLGENSDRVIVDWSPNQQIIALSRTGEALGADRQQVLFIGQNNENFPATVVEGRDLRTKWSPAGEKLLYSVYSARSDFKPELWVVNGSIDKLGSNRRLLNVNTWSDKCTFEDDRYVFCGVPEELETGAGLAPAIADSTPDRLYRIDTVTGIRTEIPMDEEHVIEELFINEDDNALYFTDKNQSGLYRVSL